MSSLKRSFLRSVIRNHHGNSKMQNIWRARQIEKHGFTNWFLTRVHCDPAHRKANTLYDRF